jgi:hypothetical protein
VHLLVTKIINPGRKCQAKNRSQTTPADVQVDGAKATLSLRGKKMYARILSPHDAAFEIGSADAPAEETQQPGVRSLRIHVKIAAESPQRIVVLLTPAKMAPISEIRPLDEWVKGAEVK